MMGKSRGSGHRESARAAKKVQAYIDNKKRSNAKPGREFIRKVKNRGSFSK